MTDREPTPPDAPPDEADEADELSADERALLDRWQPPSPPAGFADRVLAPAPARRRAPRARWFGAAALAAAAAVTTVVAWPRSSPVATVTAGAERRVAAARESVRVGERGVAVVEPGASLAWQQIGNAAIVGQDAGDVFYRVDPGGPFTVVTPVGQVKVTGTCFRVEIIMSPIKQSILSGALGAAVATAAVVTVYEGKIVVVGDGGAQVASASAGERMTMRPGVEPVTVTAGAPPAGGGGPGTITLAMPAPPDDTTTREELIRRDKIQREQLAMLAQKLQQLDRGGGGGKRGGPDGPGDGTWVDPSPAELAEWAKQCRVRIDLPPVMRGEPMKIPPDWARDVGLNDAEVAVANQVFVDLAADWKRRVRGWYVEATGDASGADALSAHAMGQELQDKAAPHEPDSLQKHIAEERAGLSRPPADLSKTLPFERYFRSMAGLGEEAERLLADKLGADKAHALRTHGGGWPMRMDMAGCTDDDGNVTGGAPYPP